MDPHYLIFMGRNLVTRKNLAPVQIMNSVSMNSKNIVNNVGIFNDYVVMNSIFSNNIGLDNDLCE